MRRFHLLAVAVVFLTFLYSTAFADSTSDFGQRDKRHDVSPGYFLQFADKGVASFSIDTERGGSWAVFGSNTLGQKGTLLAYGSGDRVLNLANIGDGYAYILVTGRGRGHIDLDDDDLDDDAPTAAVPEPGSPALILTTGLIGLAGIGRRRLVALLS
jgi:hypothetical protein